VEGGSLNDREITSIAAKRGVPKGIVEKDAALTLILHALARAPLQKSAVFKGGTAIKKAYFPQARFSGDLDFTVPNATEGQVLPAVTSLRAFSREGFSFGDVKKEITGAGLRLVLRYTGPLNYTQRARFDFSFRDDLVARPRALKIVDEYFGLSFKVRTMPVEEILAEKVRAVMTRKAPRDLYDMWYLGTKGVKLNTMLVASKFAFYGEKFNFKLFSSEIGLFEEAWENDLRSFMPEVPPFEKVKDEVLSMARKVV
jgi:predicted nucleotidyltransferase component of viral defense system